MSTSFIFSEKFYVYFDFCTALALACQSKVVAMPTQLMPKTFMKDQFSHKTSSEKAFFQTW